jgi:hypothetical protein
MADAEPVVARRDWHTRARVRVLEDAASQSVDPPGGRHFQAGEEVILLQFGRAGSPVTRDRWWDSTDVDGAHLLDASNAEVIAVLADVRPLDWTNRAQDALRALVALRRLTDAQRREVEQRAEEDAAQAAVGVVYPINVGMGAARAGYEDVARLGLGDDWWPSR